MFRKVLVLVAIAVGLAVVAGLAWAREDMTPRTPEIGEVTYEKLLEVAREVAKREGAGVMQPGYNTKEGQKVLIVSDSSSDQMCVEAMVQALREVGARADLIVLQVPTLTDPTDLMKELLEKNWLPEWVWQAGRSYDLILMNTAYIEVHNAPPAYVDETKVVRFNWVTRRLMAAEGDFPAALNLAISQYIWEHYFLNAREAHLTSELGTDLRITLGDSYWEKLKEWAQRYPYSPKSIQMPIIPGHLMILPTFAEKVEGVIVTDSLHGGHIPKTTLTLEGDRVVRIAGEGKFARDSMELFERLSGITYPGMPGPGVNWLEEISLGTNPKGLRDPQVEKLSGPVRFFGWAEGRKRAGVVHIAFGISLPGPARYFVRDHAEAPLIHRDMEFFFLNYTLDGKKVVENGYLVPLDDEPVRKLAAQFGDPDELLRLTWVPER